MKKIVLFAFVSVLLSTAVVVGFVRPVVAYGTIYIDVNGNVAGTDKIQRNGNLYTFTADISDQIVVQRSNIIIDGNGYTLQGSGSGNGFWLPSINNVTIKNINIKTFHYGVYLNSTSHSVISGNNITNYCSSGIRLYHSSNNSISGNKITANAYEGIYLEDFSNYNTINGNNITANNSFGIMLFLSSNNIIAGNNITKNNPDGIKIWHSSNNSIYGNKIAANNNIGIYLSGEKIDQQTTCLNNTIYGNNITNNEYGVLLERSSNDKFCNNNFIDNIQQVYIEAPSYANFWDDGYPSGGNFWSNYTGVDSNNDGIGDTPHVIDANNTDNYPLMGMFYSYNVFWVNSGFTVTLVSNSTVSNFDVGIWIEHPENRIISFTVTGEIGYGFCRLCIPKDLMAPPYTVIIDNGETPVLHYNETVFDNSSYRWIYFAYQHSTHEIIITPEFPTWTPMLLALIMLTIAVTIYKRKLLKTPIY